MKLKDDSMLRVLIIDSDNVRRGMLACTLPADKYSLEFAKTMEKGLDLLSQLQPEIVLVGWDHRVHDLCQRIRSLPTGTGCTLILMDERFRDKKMGETEVEATGADTFLPFPFDSDLFNQRIASAYKPAKPSVSIRGSLHPHTFSTPGDKEDRRDSSLLANEDEAMEWEAFREEVQSLYGQLEIMDYYQLLRIPNTASSVEIKDAYFLCSMAYHPDRFMQLKEEDLRLAIYNIYKRMSEAFKILSHPELRSLYDVNLGSGERELHLRFLERDRSVVQAEDPTVDAETPAGKRYLHFAYLAELEGNLRSARMYFTLALQCEPHNTALRAKLEMVTSRLESMIPPEEAIHGEGNTRPDS